MGAFTDYAKGLFEPAKKAMKQEIAQEKTAAATTARQTSLAGGVRGPVATALETQAARRVGEAGNLRLMNLDSQERMSMYEAFRADQQEQLARDIAFQQMIGNIVGGVGGAAGTLAAHGMNPPKT